VRARHDLLPDLTALTANKMSGGQQLFGSNDLVVAGREQEDWATYSREINRASERRETAVCKLIVFKEPLNDLEIIGAGQIDGARVPFAKERDQPRAARVVDYWTGEELAIDDKICLATSRPRFGGLRWFVCPRLNRRVRKLYLPLGGRHFWSRRAYRLVYGSQRETVHDRAMRRARKLCLRLGGDPRMPHIQTSQSECAGPPTIGSWMSLLRRIASRTNG
jgi:hypothetical protein